MSWSLRRSLHNLGTVFQIWRCLDRACPHTAIRYSRGESRLERSSNPSTCQPLRSDMRSRWVLVGSTSTLSFSSVQSWGKAPDRSVPLYSDALLRGLQLGISGLPLRLSLSVIGYCSSGCVSYTLSQSVSEGCSLNQVALSQFRNLMHVTVLRDL